MVTIDLVVFINKKFKIFYRICTKTHDTKTHNDRRRDIGIGYPMGSGALKIKLLYC